MTLLVSHPKKTEADYIPNPHISGHLGLFGMYCKQTRLRTTKHNISCGVIFKVYKPAGLIVRPPPKYYRGRVHFYRLGV